MKYIKKILFFTIILLVSSCILNEPDTNKELNIVSYPPLEIPPNFYIKAPVKNGKKIFIEKSKKYNSNKIQQSIFGEDADSKGSKEVQSNLEEADKNLLKKISVNDKKFKKKCHNR